MPCDCWINSPEGSLSNCCAGNRTARPCPVSWLPCGGDWTSASIALGKMPLLKKDKSVDFAQWPCGNGQEGRPAVCPGRCLSL